MSFIKNIWYVAAWSHELGREKAIGRTIINQPVALYRRSDGCVVAFEDRCAHRHAPLSLGRVEGDDLRCMYHGLLFGADGQCKSIPGTQTVPPRTCVRTFPVYEQGNWIWIWMGEPAKANSNLIPTAQGLDHPDYIMSAGALDYEADYQLINDNLCDLSHIDFVHETTLGFASGSKWSHEQPQITSLDNGLFYERWFVNRVQVPTENLVDGWSTYHYLLPGIFLMHVAHFPRGTAEASEFRAPTGTTRIRRYEQQAVTPISENRTRYLYATGMDSSVASPEMQKGNAAVINASFEEDRRMIEAQQKIWALTPTPPGKLFIAQDKGPSMMRRKIAKRLADEGQVPAQS